MIGPLKVFFAHPKSLEDTLTPVAARLSLALCVANGADTALTTGREDYLARANACGGWILWSRTISEVVMGSPRFDVVVVGDGVGSTWVGKGTVGIIEGCIDAGRTVAWWDGSGAFERGQTFREIVGLADRPDRNWTAWSDVLIAGTRGDCA